MAKNGKKGLIYVLPPDGNPKAVDGRELKDRLQVLRNSCMEGYDGTWYPSGEGREGFEAMAKGLDKVADMLGLKLKQYR